MPFHVELKDGRETVRMFNLAEGEVVSRFITPLRAGRPFVIQEQEFDPRKARLTVYEGEQLGLGQLGVGGVGWANVAKRGEDVTQRFLTGGGDGASAASMEASGRLRERVLGRLAAGPLPLNQAIGLSADMMVGHRVSDRLSAVETVIWDLLHTTAGRGLTVNGEPVAPDAWESTVLDESTWLSSGDGVALI